MKKIILLIILFLPLTVHSQTLNLRFNTYIYSWQRQDSLTPDASKTNHLRSYQNLLLNFSKNKFSFNVLFQSEGDLMNRIGKGFYYRFYNIYVKGSDLFNAFDVKAGRQYVFAGVGKGSLDGLYLKLKAGKNKEYQLAGYGGFFTRYDYEFKKYLKLKENYMVGGQLSYYGVKDLYVALSYVNKHRKPEAYTTERLDSALNTREVIIDIDSPAEQYTGLDFDYAYKLHNVFGRVYYDINLRKLSRAEVNARVTVMDNLRFSAMYLYRQPQISYNTIFWVFYHKPNQEVEGSVDYTFKNGVNAYGKVSGVIYQKDNSTSEIYQKDNSVRVQVGFNHPSFGMSFIKYFGYAGESDGVSGYFYRQIVPEKLSVNVTADFSKYRIGSYDQEKVNSFSGMLGLTYRPSSQFTFDAQGQFIKNKIYKFDSRILVGFTYWLFKKF